jgi:hypothetical protein
VDFGPTPKDHWNLRQLFAVHRQQRLQVRNAALPPSVDVAAGQPAKSDAHVDHGHEVAPGQRFLGRDLDPAIQATPAHGGERNALPATVS